MENCMILYVQHFEKNQIKFKIEMIQTNITLSLLAELEQRKNIFSTILKTSSELLDASTLA